MAVKSFMVSCSVAQAKLFVKAGVYVMPARHGQEGAPQVGYKHWMHDPEAIELPRAQAAQHPEAPVENGGGRAGQVENHHTQNRGKRRAGESHAPCPRVPMSTH